MNITLSGLVLKNFKGIRDLRIDFSTITEVYGDNATGKTTLFDAFSWLLFDKDSANKKDFDIKTLDANGNVLPGLDHEVEGTLIVDGKSVTLRKVFTEKWTKKRGSATQEFTGHTTDYFVDGVPAKLKEYKDRIDGLMDESVFKLLTSPTYFNEQMEWKARRQTLLELCGDVSENEVIESNKSLSELPSILMGRSIDDHRKVIAAKRKEINDELDRIPVRIDEANRSIPDVDGLNETVMDTEIHGLRVTIDQQSAELVKAQNGVGAAELEKRLREIDGEVLDIKNQVQSGIMGSIAKQRVVVVDATTQVNRWADGIKRLERQITDNTSLVTAKNADTARLRQEWADINTESFSAVHDNNNCPTCGQDLPAEQVQSAHDKALADFNRRKSERLERITAEGKAASGDAKRLTEENARLSTETESLQHSLSAAQEVEETAQHELDRLQASVASVGESPALITKLGEYERVSGQLLTLRESSKESVQTIQSGVAALRNQLQQREQDKAKFAQVRTIEQRIDDLKAQERTLAEEFEKLEAELYLTEEFIRTKVTLLEARINSKFKYARFKLFETQINGGLAETCETLYKGVPYGSGLNNAARINVGLDIINTLSEHHGLTAPIFVDNAEAVTQLAETNSQMIKLTVPPSFNNLPSDVKQRLISLYGDYEKARNAWEEQNKKLRVETTEHIKEAV